MGRGDGSLGLAVCFCSSCLLGRDGRAGLSALLCSALPGWAGGLEVETHAGRVGAVDHYYYYLTDPGIDNSRFFSWTSCGVELEWRQSQRRVFFFFSFGHGLMVQWL